MAVNATYRDYGHGGKGTKGAGKHQALRLPVLHGQQHRDKECLVPELRKQDEQEAGDEALPDLVITQQPCSMMRSCVRTPAL